MTPNQSDPRGQELAVPDHPSVQQLGEPGRRGDRHHRHRLLAVSAARHAAGDDREPLRRDSRVPGAAGAVLRRPGPDSPGNLAQAQARGATRHLSARIPAAHVAQRRPAPPGLFRFLHHHGQPGDRQPGQLQRGELHGFGDVLRPDLPHRDAARVHGLSELAAFARGVREVPHRARRFVVREEQALGRGTGARGDLPHLFDAHPHAGSQPASRAGDLRSLPLAAEVRRGPFAGDQQVRRRRGQHPHQDRAADEDRRRQPRHRDTRDAPGPRRADPLRARRRGAPEHSLGRVQRPGRQDGLRHAGRQAGRAAACPSAKWTAWTATIARLTPTNCRSGPWTAP